MKALKKPLSNKQAENRLNNYCDRLGYTDTCGFYGNIYNDKQVIYDIEKPGGERVHIIISRKTEAIWEKAPYTY